MTSKKIKVGIIGLGMIGKIHAQAYAQIATSLPDSDFFPCIEAVLRTNAEGDEEFIEKIGNPLITTESKDFFDQTLDIVDICTPNFLHLSQVEQAVSKGMNVYCEKPLGKNLEEARKMTAAANDAKVYTHTAFAWRYLPIIQRLPEIMKSGQIGQVNHFRLKMFHSGYLDPMRPITWRLRHADSGGGALADLGIHLIDLLRYVLGEIDWIQCTTRTYINERPISGSEEKREKVDVDDWALCTVGMNNGAVGSLEVSRIAGGKPNKFSIILFGSDGSVEVSIDDMKNVNLFSQASGEWTTLDALDMGNELLLHPLWKKINDMREFVFTAHLNSIYDFFKCISEGKQSALNFTTALKAQEVLEAAYQSATQNGECVMIHS